MVFVLLVVRAMTIHLCLVACCLVACTIIVPPVPDAQPLARVEASWDAADCGEPHRVVLELEDKAGVPLSIAVACEVGVASLDVMHWGVYLGRIYAQTMDGDVRDEEKLRVDVDAPVVQVAVDTPR